MEPEQLTAWLSCELGLLTKLPAAGFSHQLCLVLVKTIFTFHFKIPFPTDLHCLRGKPGDSFPTLAPSWQWHTINPGTQTLPPSAFSLQRMLLAGYFILWFVKSILGWNRELHLHGRACWVQDQTHHMGLRKKAAAANTRDLAGHVTPCTAASRAGVVSILPLPESRWDASRHAANLAVAPLGAHGEQRGNPWEGNATWGLQGCF